MSEREPFVHPFTFFLVDAITTSFKFALEENRNKDAMNTLYWLTGFLDTKGQKTLKKQIDEMETLRNTNTAINGKKFRDLLVPIMKELHSEGYFVQAKMRPPTRAKGLKDLQLTVDTATHGKT
jgi:hypothetical protein